MRKLFLLLIALPFLSYSQDKNVVHADRVFVKGDKIAAFEKALTAHAQKYHTGSWKWRVFTVETGPDAGAYHITEGPNSWDEIDGRGDLGKAHQADWNMNIAPLLTERGSSMYSVFRSDLSTISLTDYSNKIAINHVFPKPGYGGDVEEMIKSLKKMWDASGQSIVVYEASSSGAPQFSIVTRYKQGLKERNPNFRKPMKERFVQANGDKSFETFINTQKSAVESSWSELLYFHPELSSK